MKCPNCDCRNTIFRFRSGDRQFQTTPKQFEIRECLYCGVLFLSPQPDQTEIFNSYPQGYWVKPRGNEQELRSRLAEIYRRIMLYTHIKFVKQTIRMKSRRKTPIYLLDVGCGDGGFLEACGHTPCFGIDSSLIAVKAAKARGQNVVQGSFIKYPFIKKSFSIITMFHFLEHVSPPEHYLKAASHLLKDSGDLIIQVPNVDSLQARIFKGKWGGYSVPRHLINYSAKTLKKILHQNGFTVIRQNLFSLRDDASTLAMSLIPSLYPPYHSTKETEMDKISPMIRDLGFLGLTLISIPFTIIETILGQGATVMFHAKPIK